MNGNAAYILAENGIKKNMNANIQSIVLKETLPNGDTVHTWTFTNGTKYDMVVKGGTDSYLGEFRDLTSLIAKYPTAPVTRFAILYDAIDTDHPKATGVVSIAQYDTTKSQWITTKLNQQIPVGTSGESIGFSGGTTARLSMLTDADWNTKEFLYLDTDLHSLMMYKPSVLRFIQYDGQIVGTNPPTSTPTDGRLS